MYRPTATLNTISPKLSPSCPLLPQLLITPMIMMIVLGMMMVVIVMLMMRKQSEDQENHQVTKFFIKSIDYKIILLLDSPVVLFFVFSIPWTFFYSSYFLPFFLINVYLQLFLQFRKQIKHVNTYHTQTV